MEKLELKDIKVGMKLINERKEFNVCDPVLVIYQNYPHFVVIDIKGRRSPQIVNNEFFRYPTEEELKTFKWPELINFRHIRVTTEKDSFETSMNPNITDKEIKDYYRLGSTINVGLGPEDNLQKITKVEILN